MDDPETPRNPALRARQLRHKARAQSDQELKRLLLQQAEQIEAESDAADQTKKQAD